ncbi:MAG: VWA domain-containing protein [Pirellulales bacterium]|nr:VWA domain-containing protein [Pirellulales bacterium]
MRKRTIRGSRRTGAMLVLVGIVLVLFCFAAIFSVDVAYMQLTKVELRTATDAGARAGIESLSRLQDIGLARAAAKRIASQNNVAGAGLILDDSDIEFGTSMRQPSGKWLFQNNGSVTNAVRVNGLRTHDSASGSVQLFLAGKFGWGDFQPTQLAVATTLDRDIVIVMDRSGSMAWDLSGTDWKYPPGKSRAKSYEEAPHADLSRWAAAEDAVSAFIQELYGTPQTEFLGLVSYSSPGTYGRVVHPKAARTDAELTINYRTVDNAMRQIGQGPIAGATSISRGIDEAIRLLQDGDNARPYALKTIVLLTDGVHNHGRLPRLSAEDAAHAEIVIHTITFSNGADQTQMKEVAEIAEGKHYHAPGAAELEAIFREIAWTQPVILTH